MNCPNINFLIFMDHKLKRLGATGLNKIQQFSQKPQKIETNCSTIHSWKVVFSITIKTALHVQTPPEVRACKMCWNQLSCQSAADLCGEVGEERDVHLFTLNREILV